MARKKKEESGIEFCHLKGIAMQYLHVGRLMKVVVILLHVYIYLESGVFL